MFNGIKKNLLNRRIDLSGDPIRTRNDLIKATQSLRYKSAFKRKQHNAATIIASTVRSFLVRKSLHKYFRNELLKFVKAKNHNVVILIRLTLFVYDRNYDLATLNLVSSAVAKTCQSEKDSSFFLSLKFDENIWLYRMKRFCSLILGEVFRDKLISSVESDSSCESLLLALNVILTPEQWISSPTNARKVVSSVLCFLALTGFISRITSSVLSKTNLQHDMDIDCEKNDFPSDHRFYNAACTVAIRLSFDSGDEKCLNLFIYHFLSFPFLYSRLQSLSLDTIAKTIVFHHCWDQCISLLTTDTTLLTDLSTVKSSTSIFDGVYQSYPRIGWLLGNILQLARLAPSTPLRTTQMLLCISSIVKVSPSNVFSCLENKSSLKRYESASSSDEDEISELTISAKEKIHSLLFEQLQLLKDRTMIQSSAKFIISHSDDLCSVDIVASMLGKMLFVWPTAKNSILGSIVFGTDFVSQLWFSLSSSSLVLEQLIRTEALVQVAGSLNLFYSSYSHLLQVLDDDDFFVRNRPFTLKEVKSIVSLLKILLQRLFWTDSKTMANLHWAKQLRATAAIIFVQLRERHIRNQFADESMWLMSNTTISFMDEFTERIKDYRRGILTSRDVGSAHMDDLAFDSFEPCSDILSPGIIGTRCASLLQQVPFLLPFSDRVFLFYEAISHDRQILNENRASSFERGRGHLVKIRRNRIVEDGFEQLDCLEVDQLKGLIQIQFVDVLGNDERGIDGGGLFKEFLSSLGKFGFDSRFGLFLESDQYLLYPNPNSGLIEANHLQLFRFFGKMIGKALFEGITLEPQFSYFFLRKLLGSPYSFDDLRSLDPNLYKNLIFLKHFDQDFEQLGLFFCVVNNEMGQNETVNLIPDGSNVPVTASNRFSFLHRMANYKLRHRLQAQSDHFMSGMQDIVSQRWLNLFSANELQLLISGSQKPIDIDDWKAHCVYSGFTQSSAVIVWFWEVLIELGGSEQSKILEFCTSCSRPPIIGFESLQPKFAIQKSSSDALSLPTSSTCVNLLRLPQYRSKHILRTKLLYAIESKSGFELS